MIAGNSAYLIITNSTTINECIIIRTIVLVNLWILFIVLGSTLISFISILNLISYLDGDEQKLNLSISLLLFYLPIAIIFTVTVYHNIPYSSNDL